MNRWGRLSSYAAKQMEGREMRWGELRWAGVRSVRRGAYPSKLGADEVRQRGELVEREEKKDGMPRVRGRELP